METRETTKYRTLKFIVIGLLMTIDIFLIYLLSLMIRNGAFESSEKYDTLFVTFIIISIPSFLILTFKRFSFTSTTLNIFYLGLLKTTRQIDELKIHLTNDNKELRILTSSDKYLASIYKENISNFDQIIKHLNDRLIVGQPMKSKLNLLYIFWTTIGLTLFILTRIDH